MAFYEVQLDPQYSYGSKPGLLYQTLVIAVPSRAEQRLQLSPRAYRRLTITFNDKSLVKMQALKQFFINMAGKTHGFRVKDWTDYKATDEVFTNSSDSSILTAQLKKTYNTYGRTEVRPITKPQTTTVPVTLKRDGVSFPASGNWSLNTVTGIVTFNADQTGHTIRWSGEFDVPVRFDFDEMMPSYTDFDILDWDSVDLMEIPV